MGFYVDVNELKEVTEQYLKAAEGAQQALDDAKSSMNGIITSNAMFGQVGQAIANDINNNQNAVIVGLKDSYKLLGSEFQQAFQEFQTTTGESSESAVLSEETLIKAKTDLTNMTTTHNERRKATKRVYEEISDLIALSMPADTFKEKQTEATKHLDKVIQKVNEFDQKQVTSSAAELAAVLKQQISVAEQANGLAYTDPRFVEFAAQDQLATAIKDMDDQIAEAEKQARLQAEEASKKKQEEWAKHHPIQSWLKDVGGAIGDWWQGVVEGTKNLNIPGVKEVLLTLEGAVGAAGELIGTVVMLPVQLVSITGELLAWGVNSATGVKTPDWMMEDIHGAWETTKAIGSTLGTFAMGLAAANNPMLQNVPMFKEAYTKTIDTGKEILGGVWNDITSGNFYAIGGYVFDVASLFVGAGEVSAALKGTKWGAKIAEGAQALKTSAKVATFSKLEKMTVLLDKAVKYGDDAVKALAGRLGKIPVPVLDEVVLASGQPIKVVGKAELGDYVKVLKSDVKVVRGSGISKEIKEFIPEKIILETGETAFKSADGALVRSEKYLDEAGNIKWPDADGFVVDKTGKAITEDAHLKTGQTVDRYGDNSGRFISSLNCQINCNISS